MENLSAIGKRIGKARGNLSRARLASILGAGEKTIERWEIEKFTGRKGDLLLLAKETGYRYEWLLTGQEPELEQSGPNSVRGPRETVGYITIAINGVGFDRWQVVREPGISDVTVNLEIGANVERDLNIRAVKPAPQIESIEEPS